MSFTDPKLNYYGGTGIITEDYGTLHHDRTALATCTAVFRIKQTSWHQLPSINAAHPIFSFIGMESRDLSFSGGWAIAKCNYAGIDASADGFTEPIYELVVGLSEEPIETHPDFVTKIGGTAKAPKHGAVFRHVDAGDAFGTAYAGHVPGSNVGWVFKEFQVFDGEQLNDFAKGEIYLSATQVTWRKTYNSKAKISDLNKVGKIDSPDGSPPPLKGDRNWLNMGVTSSKRGSCYQCVQEWRASGRRGWNKTVYA